MRLKALVFMCLFSASLLGQSAAIMPMPKIQILDSNGDPLANGHCHTYETGTVTPLATYTDSTAGTANANPVVLDAAGRADIWLGNTGAYTIDCDDSANVDVWSVDGVQHIGLLLKADLANTTNTALGDALIGTIHTGTGATARTVHAKFLESVSVKDFGALGDNANDDTAEIQAALDSLSSGGSLYIPQGTYIISSDLTISANTEIYGDGMWATVLKGNSPANARRLLNTNGADNIIIRDLAVDGQYTSGFGHQCIAVMNGSNYVTVQRTRTINCGQYGIVVADTGTNSGSSGIVIRENFVDMTGNDSTANPIGIEVFPRGGANYLADPGIHVIGNRVIGDSDTDNGIKVNSQRGAVIAFNFCKDMTSTTSGNGGINISSSEHSLVHGNVVSNVRTGYQISGVAGTDNGLVNEYITVSNNMLRAYTTDGLLSAFGVRGLKIRGNTFDADGQSPADAIELDAATRNHTELEISDNYFIGSGQLEIGNGAFAAPKAVIRGNVLHQVSGIAIELVGDDALVAENVITEATAAGMQITGDRALVSFNKILDSNTASAASQAGVIIAGDDPMIIGNHVEDPDGTGDMKFGVTLSQGEDAIIRDNRFIGMADGHINNGSSLSGTPRSDRFFMDGTGLTVPVNTSENDMSTATIPAGRLGRQGGVRISAAGSVTGTNDTKTIKLYFGSTVLATITEAAGETDDWGFEAHAFAADAETGVRVMVRAYQGAAIEQFDFATVTETLSSDVVVKVTAQTANSSDSILQQVWAVEIIN